ncbi:MAG TPA: phosphatidylglycerophosphatase A [Clostridia bacterium]|nr:phosphatidylglycerophosphatase A [Clostridia bacterium]
MAAASPFKTPQHQAPLWAELVATFFGAGRMKPGPGTWGSAGAVVTWALIALALPGEALVPGAIAYAALATAIGIPAATIVARANGRKDPQKVVIDEVAGQMVALIGVPLGWKPFLAAFILFRAFDILKPPPVRQLERLPEGTGIVVDDLGAGVYALAVMQVLLHFGWLQ